jgi:NADP-dependent 3-hydroxy acid dehydrogenase YdfG
MKKTIFITGASRGFGKIWAHAFLERGDNVIVTSRNINNLSDLTRKFGSSVLTIELNISDRIKAIEAVKQAKDHFN